LPVSAGAGQRIAEDDGRVWTVEKKGKINKFKMEKNTCCLHAGEENSMWTIGYRSNHRVIRA